MADGLNPWESLDALARRGGPYMGPSGPYFPTDRLLHAARTALVLGRPLLLTGAPGSGKSEFAYVLANAIGAPAPKRCQVRSGSQARDLLYNYDSLLRYRDAQFQPSPGSGQGRDPGNPRDYIRLEPLGEALVSPTPVVVLIDEIDKAPRDLPNDLLLELELERARERDYVFEIPELRGLEQPGARLNPEMRRPAGAPPPVVVITSNAERQLPPPFLRRCIFCHIDEPDAAMLVKIASGATTLGGGLARADTELVKPLAEIFAAFRGTLQGKPPSTSEMRDWIARLLADPDRAKLEQQIRTFAKPATTLAAVAKRRAENKLTPADADAEQAARKQLDERWKDLPGLECLVKMREDLVSLGVVPA